MATSTSATLNRAQYVGLDFDTHSDDLRARLQVQFAEQFNDFTVSSIGIMLLDITAFGLDTLSFYLDRRASDTYISTARTRGSVARLSRQLGYKMGAAVASSVDLTVSIKTGVPFIVPIPKRFQFQGPDGIIFESSEVVSYPPLSTTAQSVPCYEGQSFTDLFVSSGLANQVFPLTQIPDSTFVVSGSVEVIVNGLPWVEAEFLDFAATDQFEVGYNDDPATIRFGDSTSGNIPLPAATISVRYVCSRGLAGLVNKETITAVVNPLVVMFTQIPLNVINAAGSIGGDDPETLEHAKVFAPKVFKTRYVAVTREDYESLSGAYADPLFGRVSAAQAIAARDANDDLTLLNLLGSINGLASAPVAPVQADVAQLNQNLDDTLLDLSEILDQVTSIASYANGMINTDVPTAINSARASKNSTQEILSDMTSIQGFVTNGLATLSPIPLGADQLTAPTKAALQGYFNSIDQERTSSATSATAIQTSAGSEIAALGVILDKATAIGGDLITPPSNTYDLAQAQAAIVTRIGVETPAPTQMYALLTDITDTVVDTSLLMDSLTQQVFDHVDAFLASDCQANLVVVPILSKNGAGFYAPPSLGLIKSLQSFLDARKEVTQTVSVTSGANSLIPVVLTVNVGVLQNFSQAVAETAVSTALDGLLKDRTFGQSLYISDVSRTVLAVPGIAYVNVSILGYLVGVTVNTTLNDSEGNLILDSSKVITKGTVTITSVALTGILTS